MESSSQNRLKSLKDSMLEYTAVNIINLFPALANPKIEAFVASVRTFPKYLFAEILEMSEDMCLPMTSRELSTCIAARDKLKLSENDFFRSISNSEYCDILELFSGKMRILKRFKAYIYLDDKKGTEYFEEISKAADTLEDLDLYYKLTYAARHFLRLKKFLTKVGGRKPLKLKRLRLRLDDLEWFPYTLDHDRLTVLDLYDCTLTKSFLDELVAYKRLVQLSFYKPKTSGINLDELMNAIISLKDLRFLNLCVPNNAMNASKLSLVIKKMKNLVMIELEDIFFPLDHKLQPLPPGRKLKVLNFRYLDSTPKEMRVASLSALSCLAERIGHFENLDGIMTVLSTTLTHPIYSEALGILIEKIRKKSVNLQMLSDAEKAGTFNFRSPLRVEETVFSEMPNSSSYDVLFRVVLAGMHENHTIEHLYIECALRNKKTYLASLLL